MPKRVRIDEKTYEVHVHPRTGKRFVARVSDPDDAGRLLPNGLIWWFDPDSHLSQREQVDEMLLAGRLEWVDGLAAGPASSATRDGDADPDAGFDPWSGHARREQQPTARVAAAGGAPAGGVRADPPERPRQATTSKSPLSDP